MHLLGKHHHQSLTRLWLECVAYLKGSYFVQTPAFNEVQETEGIFLCHTVEAHSCLLNMNVTFDLTEIGDDASTG